MESETFVILPGGRLEGGTDHLIPSDVELVAIDPLVASVSAVLIVGTVLLMVLLDRMVGLDRILIGEAQ